MNTLAFRNIDASPDDPLSEWPQERVIEQARGEAEGSEREAVAAEIHALVRDSGLSQAEFAARIGTSASRLSTYVTGKVPPQRR